MNIFTKTREDEIEFGRFESKVDAIYNNLKEFDNLVDTYEIALIKKNFHIKVKDFFREDRKLNIGIIGRVKAGKSTFLNTLLFDGRAVLPAAVTPKTATLTKIEYSVDNRIEVEYYTDEEWRVIERNSKVDSLQKEFIVAKEIVRLIADQNLNPRDYVGKANYTVNFETYDDLMVNLNDYIGENGKFTPLVKSVNVYVNNKDLEGISVVDTPGLYDPVVSRVDKTRQFMEICDVVFFLSKSSTFLDKNDIDLMASQLPKKGVKKLILVCSRFDDGLRDTLWNQETLEAAVEDTKKKLTNYTESAFNNYKKSNFYVNTDILNDIKKPIFVSSMLDNMSKKDVSEYNFKEKKVYDDLCVKGELTKDMMKKIGNIEEVRAAFLKIIDDKEEMLEDKSRSFVPVATEELEDRLRRLESLAEKRIAQLYNYDREKLMEQKRIITNRVTDVEGRIEEIFNELCNAIEVNKSDAIKEIKIYNREYLQVSEKEGIETHTEVRQVSTTIWFKPSTWGTSTREIYSYDEKYKYIDMFDAIENVRNYLADGVECISKAFANSIDVSKLKYKILNTIIDNIDSGNDEYDASYYKLLVEKTIQKIRIPSISFQSSKFENMISSQFNGEIKGNSMKSSLRTTLSETIYAVGEQMCSTLETSVEEFKANIENIKKDFLEQLLGDINNELETVSEQFDNKEQEIARYNELIDKIRRLDLENI
ncbi:MAG TPA: hypothetical protein DCX21_05975 [Eubacterium sp.]|nr:hypothetical protein [Eubacterium sp.]